VTDPHEAAESGSALPQAESGILNRLPALDAADPDVALSIYTEISDALVEALEGSDGSARLS
jgi:hypothetical protein